MSVTLRTSLILDLAGNLARRAGEFGGALSRLSRGGVMDLGQLSRAAEVAGRGLDNLGNRYTALLTGAAGAGTAKAVMDLETQFVELGIQANLSADKVEELKSKIYDAARAPDIRVNPGEITAAFNQIVEKTGDVELAMGNIRNIGLAISATGARGADIGALMADLAQKFQIKGGEEMLQTLDTTVNQGKLGAFTIKHFSTQAERLTAAYAQLGRVGPGAVREMGAMTQMIKQGVGGPEQTATALEAFIRTLNDPQKRKLLTGAGIKLMDPNDPKRMRSGVEIMKDIITRTKGDFSKLGVVFDSEALRALTAAALEWKKNGGFESFDSFMAAAGDGNQLLEDSARKARTSAAAMTALGASWTRVADQELSGPISAMAAAIDSLSPGTVEATFKAFAYGVGVLGAVVIATKAVRAAMAARDLWRYVRGGKYSGAGAALAGTGASGTVPVLVTNWPGGNMPGGNMPAASQTGAAGAAGKAARHGSKALGLLRGFGKTLGRIGVPLQAALYGIDGVTAAVSGDGKGVGRAAGGLGGTLAGAAAGAAIGSVVPVIGTGVGAVIGSILGSLGGEKLGDVIGGKIEIAIKSDQPVDVRRLEKSGTGAVDLSVDAGLAMAGGA